MMSISIRALFVSLALVLFAGCGGNPLVGKWISSTGGVSTTLDLKADGTAGMVVSATTIGGVSCSGMLTYSGITWTSTATTITLAGTATCAGSNMCGATTLDCTTGGGPMTSSTTSTYALTNNNNTLTVTSTSNGTPSIATFSRATN